MKNTSKTVFCKCQGRIGLILIILLSMTGITAFGKNCERMVYVYDIAVTVPNPSPELYQASDGCVEQLLLNSRASNEFFSLDFQPVRVLKPATEQALIGPGQGPSSNIDYMIWGELKETGTGRYNITLYLVTANTRLQVAKASSTFTNPSEAKFAGMTAALSLGASGTGSRRLIDVITDYEKKVREDDNRKTICPDMVYLMKEKTIEAKQEEEVLLMYQLKDTDGKPVKDADVSARCDEGSLDMQETKTDQYGMVRFKHKTPDKNTEYSIRCFAKAIAPSEKIIRVDDVIVPVKVKKKITELTGEIEIQEFTKTGNPTLANTEQGKSTFHSVAVSPLDLTIIPERIIQINKSRDVLSRALELDEFSIVDGLTMKDKTGEPVSVRSKSEYNSYLPCEDKLQLDMTEQIEGSSNGFDIRVSIALERGVETGNTTLSSLSPKYCLVITSGSNARLLFQSSKYRTTATRSGQRRDYPCGELTSFSEEVNPKYNLAHGSMKSTIKKNDQEYHEIIVPLSIPDSKALEEYLLNPKGPYSINVSGKYIKKDYEEKETQINATLLMMPKE